MNILQDPVAILQKYLQIDTTDSNNDEQACEFWKSVFSQYNVKNRILKSGRFHNFETYFQRGTGEKILFQNHLDVVAAHQESWTFDPFGGIIKGDFLYGRGALDMKSIGVMQAYAFLKLIEEDHPARELLKFCSLVQEETTSEHGARFYVDYLQKNGYQNLLVLGEGGFGFQIPEIFDGIMFLYESEQKGLLWISMTVHSKGGHGSVSGKTKRSNPVLRAAKIAQKLSSFSFPIKIEESVKIFIEKLLKQSNNKLVRIVALIPGFDVFLFRTKLGVSVLNRLITRVSRLPDLFRTSLNVTNISTDKIPGVVERRDLSRSIFSRIFRPGVKKRVNPLTCLGVNVIPTYATMTCDIRFNSLYDDNTLIDQLKKIIPDDADLRVINYQEFSSSPCEVIQSNIENELKKVYGNQAFVSPVLFIASSDNYFFRKYGHYAFGFSPIVVSLDDLQRIHGDDERIDIHAFRNGCEDYYRVVKGIIERMNSRPKRFRI